MAEMTVSRSLNTKPAAGRHDQYDLTRRFIPRYIEVVSAASPRWLRFIAPMLRAPAWLDRPGLRWALRLCSPYPVIVITHRGRRSGRMYRTPLELLTGSGEGDMFVLPLVGHRSDWYRNVTAGGLVEGSCRGRRGRLEWRRASIEEARLALDRYRWAHPLYVRALLALVARVNGVSEATSGALAESLPVLVFRYA